MMIHTTSGSYRCYGAITLKNGTAIFLSYSATSEMSIIEIPVSSILQIIFI